MKVLKSSKVGFVWVAAVMMGGIVGSDLPGPSTHHQQGHQQLQHPDTTDVSLDTESQQEIAGTCEESTNFNNTHFINPSAQDTYIGACTLTINHVDNNICQMRFDLINLNISQPDDNGVCVYDFLMVTGGMSSVPIICGYNSGQHFYYDVDPDGGHVKLTIDRSDITLLATWDIVIAQISCGSRYRAPEGCLQYYSATVGTISSFNFLPSNTPLLPGAEIVQLANQDYGVCIKRADDYCGIIYDRNTNDGDYSFTLSGDTNTLLPYLIGTFEANSRNEDCTTDYVVIPGGRYTMYANDITTFPADRYCGLGFPYTVTTTAQPFVLYFKTDGDELLDNSNRGFSLNYRQIISCV